MLRLRPVSVNEKSRGLNGGHTRQAASEGTQYPDDRTPTPLTVLFDMISYKLPTQGEYDTHLADGKSSQYSYPCDFFK